MEQPSAPIIDIDISYREFMISLEQVSYSYPRDGQAEPSLAICDVSLSVNPCEFVVVLGGTGSGKSTLLRVLGGLAPQFYGGMLAGRIRFKGEDISNIAPISLRQNIGMVFQDPEKQVVMQTVFRELAFGMENLGFTQEVMQRRICEVSSLLDISRLLHRKIITLSAGELQRVVIAGALCTMPKLLLLDEPTSQLSAQAANDVIGLLHRLNRHHGIAIVLVEHKLDDCLGVADRVLCMHEGKLIADVTPAECAQIVNPNVFSYLPAYTKTFSEIGSCKPVLSVKEAKKEINFCEFDFPCAKERTETRTTSESLLKTADLLQLCNVSVSYKEKDACTKALENINLCVKRGEILAILGQNGAGKTTLLKTLGGFLKPSAGAALMNGKQPSSNNNSHIAYVSQYPDAYLINDTVEKEIAWWLDNNTEHNKAQVCEEILSEFNLQELRLRYPRELSVGERQRVVLGAALGGNAELLLLDEPTRGLDVINVRHVKELLLNISRERNVTIVIVTQDIEFAAEIADNILLLFEGRSIAYGSAHQVLSDNLFFTTTFNKIFREHCSDILTQQDASQYLHKRVKL